MRKRCEQLLERDADLQPGERRSGTQVDRRDRT